MPSFRYRYFLSLSFISIILSAALLSGCQKIATSGFVRNFTDPYHKKIIKAGITEKTVHINGTDIHYAEGPDNGPPLLLLHAQMMDWYSYSRVLPELSQHYHVYAVDYHGQGQTHASPAAMCADTIGRDLGTFIETVIGKPTYVTGNSSGGLLTVWLAAYRPEWVKAIVLEDPPLFSAEYPRVQQTIAYRSFTTCHQYVSEGRNDEFMVYWMKSNAAFIEKHAGKKALPMLLASIDAYHHAHPGQPVEIHYLPGMMRCVLRGLSEYDPHFGDAFYTGYWGTHFDHAEALRRIRCRTLLLQADFSILPDGTLDGAMSQPEADRAISLIKGATYQKVHASHVIHLDKPKQFTKIIRGFFHE